MAAILSRPQCVNADHTRFYFQAPLCTCKDWWDPIVLVLALLQLATGKGIVDATERKVSIISTHPPVDKMVTISQTIFSDAFS